VRKPSPNRLALAVAGMVWLSVGTSANPPEAVAQQAAAGQVRPAFPNAADPEYEKTYSQYRQDYQSRPVVSTALGYEGKEGSSSSPSTGLGGKISSAGGAISSSVQKGFAKIGQAITPGERVTRAVEPTSVFNNAKPSPEVHVAVARLHEESKRLAEAEEQYRLALQLAPNHLGALLGYAHLKDRVGRWNDAIQLYQQAAAAYPGEASVFNDMGLCYARNGRYNEAMTALTRAVQLQPDKPLYRNNLAVVLVELGNTDSAFLHLQAVQPEAIARYNLGQLLLRKGQREAAAGQFALALQADPNHDASRAWLVELRTSGTVVPQSGERMAARDATAARHRPANRVQSATTPQPATNSVPGAIPPPPQGGQPAPGYAPPAGTPPAVGNGPAGGTSAGYGNYPVPPGRRYGTRRGVAPPQAGPSGVSPLSVPQGLTPVPASEPIRPTPPPVQAGQGRAAASSPMMAPSLPQDPSAPPQAALREPLELAPPGVQDGPTTNAALPMAPQGGPDSPSAPLPPELPAIAPLPPVTESGPELELLPPIPPEP
jgi:tetratricopeptide (TPR) repeat protein